MGKVKDFFISLGTKLKNFFCIHVPKSFKYTFWSIIRPDKSFSALIKEKYRHLYALLMLLVTGTLFLPFLMVANIYLRPKGWEVLFIRVAEEHIYTYFFASAQVIPILLNLLCFGTVIFCVTLLNNPKLKTSFIDGSKNLVAVFLTVLNLGVLFDLLTESVAIVVLLINLPVHSAHPF